MKKIYDLDYLKEMMGGKKHLIKEIINAYLKQVPEDIKSINIAVENKKYIDIRNIAHTLKSSFSVMVIDNSILKKIEKESFNGSDIEEIKILVKDLNIISEKSIKELQIELSNYN